MADRRSGSDAYRWERVVTSLKPADALRLALYLLRGAVNDADITDSMNDDAAEFFGRLSADDASAARIAAAIEEVDRG